MMFDYFDDFDFSKLNDVSLLKMLNKPSIFRIKGNDSSRAVVVSVLIHGCEPCGFRAMLRELKNKQNYNFDVYFLVGNVDSAKIEPLFSNRLVRGEQNFNRVWFNKDSTELEKFASSIGVFLFNLPLVASLDLHSFSSNAGSAHCYISKKDDIVLGSKLSNVLFFDDVPIGTFDQFMSKKCPSVLIECGTNNSVSADNYAFDVLQRFFVAVGVINGSSSILADSMYSGPIHVKVNSSVRCGDSYLGGIITFRSDIEQLNMNILNKGEVIGWGDSDSLVVTNGITTDYFDFVNGSIVVKKDVTPNLLSSSEFILRESGFYLFEKKEKLNFC